MLFKLAFSGFRSRLRSFAILFSGLIFSSAIFYMFQAMATNKKFVQSNITLSLTGAIFQIGSVLLILITLVYISYANSFLMSMRRHDYGLYMMLGAKKRRIGELILIETLGIGAIATTIGIVIGVIVTAFAGRAVGKMMHISLTHFAALYWPAVLVTLIAFLAIFLVAGVLNQFRMTRTNVMTLLRFDQQANRAKLKPAIQVIETILGVILIATGYWFLANIGRFQLTAIWVALITIILGTYFVFNAVIVSVVAGLKRTSWANKGLRNFTLSQLGFRIRNYTRMLSLVAIIFAMGLGAIIVGLGFNRQTLETATAVSPYTMVVNNPTKAESAKLNDLNPSTNATYAQKTNAKTHRVYFKASEFNKQPLLQPEFQATNSQNALDPSATKIRHLKAAALKKNPDAVGNLVARNDAKTKYVWLSDAQFAAQSGQAARIQAVTIHGFANHINALYKIDDQHSRTGILFNGAQVFTQVTAYRLFNGIYGGLAFMGVFLGIAFLGMLASCLMFKVLSGAESDAVRYRMLAKIGTRQSLLKRAINLEVGVLFAAPAILGLIHVLFGLQMFKSLLVRPYQGLWISAGIFFLFYLLYYLGTVVIYQQIVLPKKQSR